MTRELKNVVGNRGLLRTGASEGNFARGGRVLKTMATFLLWLLLWFLCWPLALLALVLYPLLWVLLLPFRIVGLTFDALFAFLRALFFLPARILGERRAA
jgi:hypothetical protein